MRYVYTMEYYYSAIKKNEIMSFATIWMDLEIVISEWRKSNREGQILYDITYYMESKKNGINKLTHETEIELQI